MASLQDYLSKLQGRPKARRFNCGTAHTTIAVGLAEIAGDLEAAESDNHKTGLEEEAHMDFLSAEAEVAAAEEVADNDTLELEDNLEAREATVVELVAEPAVENETGLEESGICFHKQDCAS